MSTSGPLQPSKEAIFNVPSELHPSCSFTILPSIRENQKKDTGREENTARVRVTEREKGEDRPRDKDILDARTEVEVKMETQAGI